MTFTTTVIRYMRTNPTPASHSPNSPTPNTLPFPLIPFVHMFSLPYTKLTKYHHSVIWVVIWLYGKPYWNGVKYWTENVWTRNISHPQGKLNPIGPVTFTWPTNTNSIQYFYLQYQFIVFNTLSQCLIQSRTKDHLVLIVLGRTHEFLSIFTYRYKMI